MFSPDAAREPWMTSACHSALVTPAGRALREEGFSEQTGSFSLLSAVLEAPKVPGGVHRRPSLSTK